MEDIKSHDDSTVLRTTLKSYVVKEFYDKEVIIWLVK